MLDPGSIPVCRILVLVLGLSLGAGDVSAQDAEDDPIYDRPFVANLGGRTAVGGYVEGNTNYFAEDGVSEGFSMELRRFNLFLYSSIGSRLSFFSELEFEHGTEEIKLETALVDFAFSPAIAARLGILLPPLGAFNQNHDSPKWDIVDRPLVSTQIIPSTLSEVGFGLHGQFYLNAATVAYQVYLVNGLGAGVVSNDQGRTFLPSGKSDEAFGEDNNGSPSLTARVSARNPDGEIGLSYYTGVYNNFRVEGDEVDKKRSLSVVAIDGRVALGGLLLQGEAAYAHISVPDNLRDLFGEKQTGGFLEVVVPVFQINLFRDETATLSAIARAEYVDFNRGPLGETGGVKYDDVTALVIGASFRPTAETVFKTNYRYHWVRDLLGNPARLGGIQVGFATYF